MRPVKTQLVEAPVSVGVVQAAGGPTAGVDATVKPVSMKQIRRTRRTSELSR